jgi:hypothetical protein
MTRSIPLAPLAVLLACVFAAPAAAQWTDLGGGLAGTSGTPPVLAGLGPQIPTASTKLTVTGGLPSQPGYLLLGLSALNAPFKGGTLFPNPDVLLVIATDAAGMWTLVFSWPTEIPFGTQLWWQVWLPDAGGPKGWAATNGLHSVAS